MSEATFKKKFFDSLTEAEYEQYRHGFNCPKCRRPMVERKNKTTKETFFGCSRYPLCYGSRDIDGKLAKRPSYLD